MRIVSFKFFVPFLVPFVFLPSVSIGQSKEEQLKKLKEDLQMQQQQIQFIQDQHDNAKKNSSMT